MDNLIKRAYNMLYSPILTPYNLVENSKLDNYKYVKYFKESGYLICEMLCNVDSEDVLFLYYFDMDDKLVKATMVQNDDTKILFDREKEISSIKSKIKRSKVKASA